MNKKTAIISGFLVFGLVVGVFTGWMVKSLHSDTLPYINLPGVLIGSLVFHGDWADYIVASTAFWGLLGLLLATFLKPKIIIWIFGTYLVIFGALTALYFTEKYGITNLGW